MKGVCDLENDVTSSKVWMEAIVGYWLIQKPTYNEAHSFVVFMTHILFQVIFWRNFWNCLGYIFIELDTWPTWLWYLLFPLQLCMWHQCLESNASHMREFHIYSDIFWMFTIVAINYCIWDHHLIGQPIEFGVSH